MHCFIKTYAVPQELLGMHREVRTGAEYVQNNTAVPSKKDSTKYIMSLLKYLPTVFDTCTCTFRTGACLFCSLKLTSFCSSDGFLV